MLFLVSGASGAGKSTVRELAAPRLGSAFEAVELRDLGSVENVTVARRQELAEEAAKRAALLLREGRHLLLSGDPVAPAEIVAVPSATTVGGIAVCLLDIDAVTQADRLAERGDDPLHLEAHTGFAQWMREHAVDPAPRLDVLSSNGWHAMRWERLASIVENDPRWRVHRIDTSKGSREDVAERVVEWINAVRIDDSLVMRPEEWD